MATPKKPGPGGSARSNSARARSSRAGTVKTRSKQKPGSTAPAAAVKTGATGRIRAVARPVVPAFSGGHLLLTLFDSSGRISVDRVAKRFGMSKGQLAETIGLRPEAVYRAARLAAPKTQTRTTEMLEIIGRIADWAGGEKQAMAWYRAEPIAAFGGRTAESLVKEGKASAVRDYLDHVATGGFA